LLHVGLVARLPAAAVNPDDDRELLALGRGVDIELLPFVLRLGVGQAAVDLRLPGEERAGDEEDEQGSGGAHGGRSPKQFGGRGSGSRQTSGESAGSLATSATPSSLHKPGTRSSGPLQLNCLVGPASRRSGGPRPA